MTTGNELDGLEVKTGGELDRCSVSQLRNLLRLGFEPSRSSTSLPAEAGDTQELARLLTSFLPEEAESGQVLLDTVCEPDTRLPVLEQLKDLAKRLVEQAPSEQHKNAGRVLYHAAIAAAYARHGENISTQPIGPRLPLYEDLATVLGGKPLGEVFLLAAERASEGE